MVTLQIPILVIIFKRTRINHGKSPLVMAQKFISTWITFSIAKVVQKFISMWLKFLLTFTLQGIIRRNFFVSHFTESTKLM